MESNSIHSNVVEEDDRFSQLPDDILIYILGKTNIHTYTRASFLSTRWRHLPSSLPHISLNIWDFMRSYHTPVNHIAIDEAMAAISKAARMCLAASGKGSTMKTVNLRLCLTANYLHDIGNSVCKAVDNGSVKSVEFALPTAKSGQECNKQDMAQLAKKVVYFFNALPNLFRCLTRLILYNASFDGLQMHRLLNTCEQLQHLVLNNCDTGHLSVLKIDMPNSKISSLRLNSCRFEKIEFVCLPQLETIHCECWISSKVPFSIGYVPRLKEVSLGTAAALYQSGFYLSEVLHCSEIEALTLEFHGEKIWMLPEENKLRASFNKLTKMFIHDIYVKFGLSWMISLLETAPSLRTFGIEVWHHVCGPDIKETRRVFGTRTNPWQKKNKFNGSMHLQLTMLEFVGFMAVKKHMQFIRDVMDYAPNLETILLQDKDSCECCDEVKCPPRSSMFPKNKDEKDMVLCQLGIGISRSTQIIFN